MKGEVQYALDRRLCLVCGEIEKREFGERVEGPTAPGADREITPEEAAEILGTDLVLVERRIQAGALPFREIDGQIKINLMHVLDLKRVEDARNKLLLEASQIMEGLETRKP